MSDTVPQVPPTDDVLAPSTELEVRVPELSKDWQKKIIGTWLMKNPDHRTQIFRATQPADKKLEEILAEDEKTGQNTLLPIVSWSSYPVLSTDDETGEVKGWYQTCIFLADGTRVSSGSVEVLKSLLKIEAFDGRGPYHPPKAMVVKSAKSKRKYIFHYLDYADQDTIRTDD